MCVWGGGGGGRWGKESKVSVSSPPPLRPALLEKPTTPLVVHGGGHFIQQFPADICTGMRYHILRVIANIRSLKTD